MLATSLLWAVVGQGAPKSPPSQKLPAFPALPSVSKAEAPAASKEAPAAEGKPEAAPADESEPSADEPDKGDAKMAAVEPAVDEAEARKRAARDRYKVILIRNPFGLNPPPPPVEEKAEPEPEPEPELTIYLTGITTLLGTKKAFLKTDDPKETDKAKKFHYYAMKEGESRDGLEVVSIDVETGSVKINHKSVARELNLKDNGIEAVAAPAAAGKPGVAPGGRKLPPGMSPKTPGARPTVTRPVSVPSTGRTPTARPTSLNNRSAYNRTTTRPPSVSIPGRTQRSNAATTQSLNGGRTVNLPVRPTRSSNAPLLPPPPKVDPEEQKVLIELNREVNRLGREQEDLIMPPLPPIDQ